MEGDNIVPSPKPRLTKQVKAPWSQGLDPAYGRPEEHESKSFFKQSENLPDKDMKEGFSVEK